MVHNNMIPGVIPETNPFPSPEYQAQPTTTPIRYIIAGDSSVTSGPSTPELVPQIATNNRSFIGELISGLKRIPQILEKRRLQRRPTFGIEASNTTAADSIGQNTLPRYLSNPSIGPSNPQFAHRLSRAAAADQQPESR